MIGGWGKGWGWGMVVATHTSFSFTHLPHSNISYSGAPHSLSQLEAHLQTDRNCLRPEPIEQRNGGGPRTAALHHRQALGAPYQASRQLLRASERSSPV
jgi:hypothetical protein